MISKTRWSMRAVCFGLALTALACAKGANTFDDTVNGTGGAAAVDPNCGDGVVQTNEQCDPQAALPATVTCQALTGGTGTPACNPTTCMLDTTMCTSAATGVAGH